MNANGLIVRLLVLIPLCCLGCKETEDITFTGAPYPACGVVAGTFPAPSNANGTPLAPTTTTGPTLMTATVGSYGGTLTVGNQYGTCAGQTSGKFGPPPDGTWDSWAASGTINITPPAAPTFAPAALTMPALNSANVNVTVTPACSYTLTISDNDEPQPGAQATIIYTPDPLATGPTGTAPLQVTDALGVARGPITVTLTITPGAPCTAAPPVTGTFTVTFT